MDTWRGRFGTSSVTGARPGAENPSRAGSTHVAQKDAYAGLLALGGAPVGTRFEALIEESRPHLLALVPGNSMNAQWLPANRNRAPLGLYNHVLDGKVLRDYVLEYWKSDPMTPRGLLRDGRATTLARCAGTRRALERTPYWNDLVRPIGIRQVLGVSCALPRGELFQLASHRGPGEQDWKEADLRRWELGGAELARAVAALSFRDGHEDQATSGALLFDRQAQLVHADQGGGAIFARLVAERRGAWLASLVRDVAAAGDARDRIAATKVGKTCPLQLRLSVAPGLTPGPIVLVALALEVDPCERVRQRAVAAGLSPREVAVVELVARGLSNNEAAATLGVRPVTVRDHLSRAFAALGVGSRTELVVRLLGGARPGGG